MDETWTPVESPRYAAIPTGRPPRPSFEMVNQPDGAKAADNTNDWFILRDNDVKDESFWSSNLSKKWAAKTTVTSTPNQINEALYGSGPVAVPGRGANHDADMGYLFADTEDPKELNHCHCDVDTTTGNLVRPVKHPRTFPAMMHEYDEGNPDRKNRTSEDVILQMITNKTKETKKSSPQKAYQDAILDLEDVLRTRPLNFVGERLKVPQSVTFRPALASDIEEITSIYNVEVTGDGMAPDSKVVNANAFTEILKACQGNMKPFIVAVKSANHFADISKWPDSKALDDWLRLKRAQGEPVDHGQSVIGFAHLCPFDFGIWAGEGNAQHSAKIRCFVSPAHRREGIGRALIDLMLQMTVTSYKAKCDSVWDCSCPMQVFDRVAIKNAKKYHRIFIEVYFKNKGDPRFEGLKTLLENLFGFTPMGHILGAYLTARGEESVWLDKFIWGLDCVHQDEIGWFQDTGMHHKKPEAQDWKLTQGVHEEQAVVRYSEKPEKKEKRQTRQRPRGRREKQVVHDKPEMPKSKPEMSENKPEKQKTQRVRGKPALLECAGTKQANGSWEEDCDEYGWPKHNAKHDAIDGMW